MRPCFLAKSTVYLMVGLPMSEVINQNKDLPDKKYKKKKLFVCFLCILLHKKFHKIDIEPT